jgi:predicted secreted acid phosphatase
VTRALGLLCALLLALGATTATAEASAPHGERASSATAKRAVPPRAQWLADVRAAMRGFGGYARQRVADRAPGERLAVNFDIDNTVLATYYDGGGAIPKMRRFARLLDRLDVALVFNTGRAADQRQATVRQLRRAGFDLAEVCLRNRGEALVAGKQRCRDHFAAEGYTLVANVGNNDTDFVGDRYERAFRLPNYGVLG